VLCLEKHRIEIVIETRLIGIVAISVALRTVRVSPLVQVLAFVPVSDFDHTGKLKSSFGIFNSGLVSHYSSRDTRLDGQKPEKVVSGEFNFYVSLVCRQ